MTSILVGCPRFAEMKKEPALSSPRGGELEVVGPIAARSLKELSRALGRIYSVRLDGAVPKETDSLKSVKEFCVGLLEKPKTHVWGAEVSRLTPRDQLSVAGSLFLARKVLPSVPDPNQMKKHAALMSKPAPPPPQPYLDFLEKEVRGLFPKGWDRRYKSHVLSYSPSSSSSLESGRRSGGAQLPLSEFGTDWFQDCTLGGGPGPRPYPVRFSVVQTSGKQRGVTVASSLAQVLGPLHRTIYDHISQFDWLLRGEARGRKFHSFKVVEGEVIVSGDYEAATDNLNTSVAELILSVILDQSSRIPQGIRDYAMSSLRATISYADGVKVDQVRGQLMGNFLSFPLLCLQNYLAFKFLIPRPVPVKINGDDIVFRCRPAEYEKWASGISDLGLVLSRGKTLVDRRRFSLNSSFFIAGSGRVREVPVIRLKVVTDGRPSGGDFVRFVRGWRGEAHTLVGALWLRRHAAQIKACGRSVVKGLGIPADNAQLHHAGLSVRETFFRGSRKSVPNREVPVPMFERKVRPDVLTRWVKVPKGLVARTGLEAARWVRAFREDCFRSAWSRPCVLGDSEQLWWEEVKSSGSEPAWRAWRRTCRRMPKIFRHLQLPLISIPRKSVVKTEWVPRDRLPRAGMETSLGPIDPELVARPPTLFGPVEQDGFVTYRGWHGLGVDSDDCCGE